MMKDVSKVLPEKLINVVSFKYIKRGWIKFIKIKKKKKKKKKKNKKKKKKIKKIQ